MWSPLLLFFDVLFSTKNIKKKDNKKELGNLDKESVLAFLKFLWWRFGFIPWKYIIRLFLLKVGVLSMVSTPRCALIGFPVLFR